MTGPSLTVGSDRWASPRWKIRLSNKRCFGFCRASMSKIFSVSVTPCKTNAADWSQPTRCARCVECGDYQQTSELDIGCRYRRLLWHDWSWVVDQVLGASNRRSPHSSTDTAPLIKTGASCRCQRRRPMVKDNRGRASRFGAPFD